MKKHQRPNPMKGVTGGIVEKEMPLHISNVALFNPATKKADRVGVKHAGRRPPRALLQVQRRSGGRMSEKDAKKDKAGKARRRASRARSPQQASQAAEARQGSAPKKRSRRRSSSTRSRRGPTQPARLQVVLPRAGREGPHAAVRLQDRDAGAAHREDRAQHGRGRSGRRQEDHGQRGRRHDQDRRPEAAGHQGAQVGRELQDPRRLSRSAAR